MRCTLLILTLLLAGEALAASSGTPPALPGSTLAKQADAAFERGEWATAARLYERLAARRRWDDEVWNRLGFSRRKLGDYRRALAHYDRALSLNPYHRRALEYLGEAFVEMGRHEDARATLERLAAVCRMTDGADDWCARCPEWGELAAVIAGGSGSTASHARGGASAW